jgi:hypothetical protein
LDTEKDWEYEKILNEVFNNIETVNFKV